MRIHLRSNIAKVPLFQSTFAPAIRSNQPINEHHVLYSAYINFIEEMLKHLKYREYSPGEFLCHQGDIGDEMFIILHGRFF